MEYGQNGPTFWQRRRVLVTGGTGFVGGHLIQALLKKGASVVVFLRDFDPQSALFRDGFVSSCSVVQGSLEDYSAVERALNEHSIQTIFHLGAQTLVGTAYRSPLATFESNIRGTYHLLEAVRRLSPLVQEMVIASSDKVYGEGFSLPYTEETPLKGRHPYDVSKACADMLALSYAHTYALPLSLVRCGNIFGGGDLNWSRLIPGTIKSLCEGEPPLIRSQGIETRDYLFIEDAIDAYLRVALLLGRGKGRGEAFNIGPGSPQTVLQVVDKLRVLLGREDLKAVILANAQAEIQNQSLDATKAYRELGWAPRYTLEEALKQTVSWYRSYLENPLHVGL